MENTILENVSVALFWGGFFALCFLAGRLAKRYVVSRRKK